MSAIELVSEVPGPRSRQAAVRAREATPRGPFHVHEVFVESARGARVRDLDGNTLLDFTGGLGVLNVGWSHPAVVEAVRAQAERCTHACWHVAMYEPYLALCERLNALAPTPGPRKTFLCNSGAEAVENAVKIARAATGRKAVVAFEHGFHGRTLLGMSLTSKWKPYKRGFGPFAPEVYRLPYPYAYRGWDAARAADEADARLRSSIAPGDVACVVIEPVLGEGGFVPAPPEFLQRLAATCRELGILLVADEIQSGMGRCGRWFDVENAGVRPDLVIAAKSLGGGLPIAAVTGPAEIMDAPEVGGLGGTYGGNPLACAAALATLDVIEREGLLERARAIGARVAARFAAFQERFPYVGDARGRGAMMALELVEDRGARTPATERTAELIRRAARRGLLLLSAGTWSNVIRTLMPLVIDDDELDEGLAVLEAALEEVR